MCAHRALTDIEVEADVTQSPDDIPTQDIETKVKAVEYLDPQVIRLHLQTPRSRRLRFIAEIRNETLRVRQVAPQFVIGVCFLSRHSEKFHSLLEVSGKVRHVSGIRIGGPAWLEFQ